MRILMIGGTRFMGPYILKNLHATRHEVALFHRGQTSTALPEGVEEILGDRDQLADYASTLRAWQPDVVLDMIQATEKQAQQFVEVFAGFTRRTVVASSQDVYRAFGRVNRTESSEVDPATITEDSPLCENLYPHRDFPGGADYDKTLVERVIMSNPNCPAQSCACLPSTVPAIFSIACFPISNACSMVAQRLCSKSAWRTGVGRMGTLRTWPMPSLLP